MTSIYVKAKSNAYEYDIASLVRDIENDRLSLQAQVRFPGDADWRTLAAMSRVPATESTECVVGHEGASRGPFFPCQVRNLFVNGELTGDAKVSWHDGSATVAELMQNPTFSFLRATRRQFQTNVLANLISVGLMCLFIPLLISTFRTDVLNAVLKTVGVVSVGTFAAFVCNKLAYISESLRSNSLAGVGFQPGGGIQVDEAIMLRDSLAAKFKASRSADS